MQICNCIVWASKKLEHGLGVQNIVYTRGAPKQVEVIISASVLEKQRFKYNGLQGLDPEHRKTDTAPGA